jgi:hypothetical protein
MATEVTPQRLVKKCYEREAAIKPGEEEVINRMRQCTGVLVYRVCQKTKDCRGEGALEYCVGCNRRTNTFCIKCKKWLCNIQMTVNPTTNGVEGSSANKEDPKHISITFDDGKVTGKPKKNCAIYSCWYKSHQTCP